MAPRSQALKVVSEEPAVAIGAARQVVRSERIGRTFQVTVTRPAATPFVPNQTFPVMVALDDGLGIAGPMTRFLGNAGAMAPALAVCVGYPTEQAGENHRNTDLSHVEARVAFSPEFDTIAFGAGGAAFADFLSEDLIPFIADHYPADRSQIGLFGHSLGGLFVANVLAQTPSAFAAYMIGSPSVWIDPGVVERVERGIAKAKGARVFLGVGSHEDAFQMRRGEAHMLNGFLRLDAALRRQPHIASMSRIYPDEGHVSVYSRIIEDGFPFVFPPKRALTAPQSKSNPKALARYAGLYTLPDGRKVTVACSASGQVTAQVTDLPEVPIVHIGGGRFYAPTSDLDVVFDKAGFTITGGGATWRGVRG